MCVKIEQLVEGGLKKPRANSGRGVLQEVCEAKGSQGQGAEHWGRLVPLGSCATYASRVAREQRTRKV